MAYVVKSVKAFDKGVVDQISDEKIPQSASSRSVNFLDLGDRIELVRGQLILGAENVTAGFVTGLGTVRDVDGTEFLYKGVGTNIERYRESTDDWNAIKSNLVDDSDLSMVPYRTPAGSFLWISSKKDGPLRVNAADQDSIVDFYSAAKNYHGLATIQDNRMFLWKVEGNETILYLSYIDDDYPYTAITNESIATGDGVAQLFSGTLLHPYVVGRSLSINGGPEVFTDDGNGLLTSPSGEEGTINYSTGAWSVLFGTPPINLAAITATYDYEVPNTTGVSDFTYSTPTRLAGQGDFFFQAQGSDEIQTVLPFDQNFYVLHERSIWFLDLTDDDTGAINKIYRSGTGIPNPKAAVATGDGIFYIDDSDEDNKVARILEYNELSSKVIPSSKSDQIDLNGFNFDDAACIEFGDFIVTACKEGEAESNDTLLLYNKKWDLWNVMDGFYRCFAIHNGVLVGGSSVDRNVYQIFSGFDDQDSEILGVWESRDWDLDTEELKKCKKIVVEGEMAESQELIVEVSFDEQDFIELGRIAGDSVYVQDGPGTEYGSIMYGADTYGAGDTVVASRYMREFKLGSTKFYRVKVRFRTEEIGYLNIKQFTYKDVRLKGYKLPAMFRS